jgi:hypothetical protein
MRIFEVIDMYSDRHAAFNHSSPPSSTSEMDEPNPSLLDLMYRSLTRDGHVIAPGAFNTDFVQSDDRHEGDDEWVSGEILTNPDNYYYNSSTQRPLVLSAGLPDT